MDQDAHGLEELIEATAAVAPAAVRNAFAAAQEVSRSQKREQAWVSIHESQSRLRGRVIVYGVAREWAHMFASIAAIYNIPRTEVAPLAEEVREVIQLRRILVIGNNGLLVVPFVPVPIYGVSLVGVLAINAAKAAAAPLVARLFREIPVAALDDDPNEKGDSKVGSGLAAAQVTAAVGEAWIETCEHEWQRNYPDPPEIADRRKTAEYFATRLQARLPSYLSKWNKRSKGTSKKGRKKAKKPFGFSL